MNYRQMRCRLLGHNWKLLPLRRAAVFTCLSCSLTIPEVR